VSARAVRRRVASGVMTGLVALLCVAAVLPLLFIFGDLIHKGATSLDWNFFTHSPVPAGQTGGGVAHAIVGTGIVVGLACLIGLPIGIGAGVFLAEYGSGKLGWVVRFVADVMNGTPSIVIGIFAWAWLVRPVGHFSALAGGGALAMLMVPMLARTTEEMVRLVDGSRVVCVCAASYFAGGIETEEQLEAALTGLREQCIELIGAGKKVLVQ